MKTPTPPDAEERFRQFLAGFAVPRETFQTLSPERDARLQEQEENAPQEENALWMQGGNDFLARPHSARRQFWLRLHAACRPKLEGILAASAKLVGIKR